MRPVLWAFLLAVSALWLTSPQAHAQWVADPFDDGSLTTNPTWQGDLPLFAHDGGVLRLDAPESDSSVAIALPFVRNLSASPTEWQLWVRLDALVSDARQLRFYLASSAASLRGPLDGYYVELGQTGGEGRVRLRRQTGTGAVTVLQSRPGLTDAYPTLRIRVRRSAGATATWELAVDPSGGRDFAVEATTLETGFLVTSFTGLFIRYSAGASRHFALDDFGAGSPPPDLSGPRLARIEALSATELQATFDEPVSATQVAANYSVAGIGTALSAARELSNRAAVRLSFAVPFSVGVNQTLTATGVADALGNPASSSADFIWWNPQPAIREDLIVAELLPDPSPPIGLPEAEYVEVFNRASYALDLCGWTMSDAAGPPLPLPQIILPPRRRLLLVSTPLLSRFSSVADRGGIPAPTSWLNNDRDTLTLRDAGGRLIHQIGYRTDRFPPGQRAEDGRSLERIDLDTPCPDPRLYQPSRDPSGGTPAAPNSVTGSYLDSEPPLLITWATPSATRVELTFDGPLDTTAAQTEANYQLTYPTGSSASPLLAELISPDRVRLLLPTSLDSVAPTTLTITSLIDCAGNPLTTALSLALLRLRAPRSGELLINELLATPLTGGERYVELISIARVGLDVSQCRWARVRGGDTDEVVFDAEAAVPLLPGEVVALSADVSDVRLRYAPPMSARLSPSAELPAIAETGDRLELRSPSGQLLDRLDYHPDLHSRVLNDLRGVALERTHPSLASQAPATWHSAAATVRYGTPGYANSRLPPADALGIRLASETFSPNGDGLDDVLRIVFDAAPADALLTLDVADLQGRLCRSLAHRLLLPTLGELTWDGRDDSGALMAPGIYLVVARLSTGGAESVVRLPCVLARTP